jgi:hypothetical protein
MPFGVVREEPEKFLNVGTLPRREESIDRAFGVMLRIAHLASPYRPSDLAMITFITSLVPAYIRATRASVYRRAIGYSIM